MSKGQKLCKLLWALGWLPLYVVALALSLAITIGVLARGLPKLRRMSVDFVQLPATIISSMPNADDH